MLAPVVCNAAGDGDVLAHVVCNVAGDAVVLAQLVSAFAVVCNVAGDSCATNETFSKQSATFVD